MNRNRNQNDRESDERVSALIREAGKGLKPPVIHPDGDSLWRFVHEDLPEDQATRIRRHLIRCSICFAETVALERLREADAGVEEISRNPTVFTWFLESLVWIGAVPSRAKESTVLACVMASSDIPKGTLSEVLEEAGALVVLRVTGEGDLVAVVERNKAPVSGARVLLERELEKGVYVQFASAVTGDSGEVTLGRLHEIPPRTAKLGYRVRISLPE